MKTLYQLPDDKETLAIRNSIKSNSEKTAIEMQSAIMAFQFYDKLTQRLMSVSNSIESLSELVKDTQKICNPLEWHHLQDQIKSKYTM